MKEDKKKKILEEFYKIDGKYSHVNNFDNPEAFEILEDYRNDMEKFITNYIKEL